MFGAVGIKRRAAVRAKRSGSKILVYTQLTTAGTAKNGFVAELVFGPGFGGMRREVAMTVEACVPLAAAFEFDGNDVER